MLQFRNARVELYGFNIPVLSRAADLIAMSMSEQEPIIYADWKGWDAEAFGRCSRAEALAFAQELRSAGIVDAAGLRVLELGFGNGTFAAWCMRSGALWVGTELSDVLVNRANAKGWQAFLSADLGDLEKVEPFDLVAAWDVFEHMGRHEIAVIMERIRMLLKPGGVLIARVPSGDSPFGRFIQHGDMTHQLTLGSCAVRQLCAASGFSEVRCREPVLPVWGLGWWKAVRRGLVHLLRRLSFPVIGRGLMGQSGLVLTPNLVFVARRPR